MEILSYANIKKTKPNTISKADGAYIYDEKGNKLFDSMSGLWTVPFGYSQESIKKAISDQLYVLPSYHNFFSTDNLATRQLSKAFSDLLNDEFYIYYSNSGSMANETALRAAIANNANDCREKKILCLKRSYHGSSLVTSQISDQSTKHFGEMIILDQVIFFDPFDDSGAFDRISFCRFLKENAKTIGIAVIEPTIGAGGVYEIPTKDLQEVILLLKELKIFSIVDEVITGFGKRGSLLVSQDLYVRPDFITLGKGMTNGYFPMAATLIKKTVLTDIKWFNHGFTFSGHPLGARAALETLQIFDQNKQDFKLLFNTIRSRQEQFDHSFILAKRQSGCLVAIDFSKKMNLKKLTHQLWKDGVVVTQASGQPQTLCACLPLISSEQQIHEFYQTLQKGVCAAN